MTQLEAARLGKITYEMEEVADQEGLLPGIYKIRYLLTER